MPNNMTDTEMLDWLTALSNNGYAPGLVNDDNGHWALSFGGVQEVPEGDGPQDMWTSFLVEKGEWHNTPRAAIQATYEQLQQQEDKEDG